jgi:hypothetical protein
MERDRETETETERQRDRETERQRDRETERQRDRETERQRDRETERQRDRETERWTEVRNKWYPEGENVMKIGEDSSSVKLGRLISLSAQSEEMRERRWKADNNLVERKFDKIFSKERPKPIWWKIRSNNNLVGRKFDKNLVER